MQIQCICKWCQTNLFCLHRTGMLEVQIVAGQLCNDYQGIFWKKAVPYFHSGFFLDNAQLNVNVDKA